MKAPLTIRVEVTDLAEWQRQANLKGLSISEWIRRRCNADEKPNLSQDALGTTEVPVARRSNSKPRGTERSDDGPKQRVPEATGVEAGFPDNGVAQVKRIKLCRHNLLDCTVCG